MDKAERLQELLNIGDCKNKAHIELPSVSKCRDILDDLDKPALDLPTLTPPQREILQSLVDGRGCVIKIGPYWRWVVVSGLGYLDEVKSTTSTWNVKKMIEGGFLYEQKTKVVSGMTSYAWVTDAGYEAIK